jgi:hypothetical protein
MQPDPDLSRALERVLELAEPRTPGALARAAERARLNGDESKAKDLEGLASFRE